MKLIVCLIFTVVSVFAGIDRAEYSESFDKKKRKYAEDFIKSISAWQLDETWEFDGVLFQPQKKAFKKHGPNTRKYWGFDLVIKVVGEEKIDKSDCWILEYRVSHSKELKKYFPVKVKKSWICKKTGELKQIANVENNRDVILDPAERGDRHLGFPVHVYICNDFRPEVNKLGHKEDWSVNEYSADKKEYYINFLSPLALNKPERIAGVVFKKVIKKKHYGFKDNFFLGYYFVENGKSIWAIEQKNQKYK